MLSENYTKTYLCPSTKGLAMTKEKHVNFGTASNNGGMGNLAGLKEDV